MILQTKYDIKFPIDDKELEVVYAPLTINQKKELEVKRDELNSGSKSMDAWKKKLRTLRSELNLNLETFENNKQLIALGSDDKNSLLVEQGELLKERKKITKEIEQITSVVEDLSTEGNNIEDIVSELGEMEFDFCISGKDRDAVKKYITDGYFSYLQVINVIATAAAELSQKK